MNLAPLTITIDKDIAPIVIFVAVIAAIIFLLFVVTDNMDFGDALIAWIIVILLATVITWLVDQNREHDWIVFDGDETSLSTEQSQATEIAQLKTQVAGDSSTAPTQTPMPQPTAPQATSTPVPQGNGGETSGNVHVYQIAMGDLLGENGTCYIKVSKPDEPVFVPAEAGVIAIEEITANSETSLARQVAEFMNAGARSSDSGECPLLVD